MKRAFWIAGLLVVAPLCAAADQAPSEAATLQSSVPPDSAGVQAAASSGRTPRPSDAAHLVAEPGTMAITSLGLLAAAALRKKRAHQPH